jgi:hypothetical protein
LQSILYYRMGAVKSKSDHSAHRHAERQIIQQPPEQQQPPYNGVLLYIYFFSVLSNDPTTCHIESYRRQSN